MKNKGNLHFSSSDNFSVEFKHIIEEKNKKRINSNEFLEAELMDTQKTLNFVGPDHIEMKS